MCTQEVHSLMIDSVVNNTVGPLDSSDDLIGRLLGLLASGWSKYCHRGCTFNNNQQTLCTFLLPNQNKVYVGIRLKITHQSQREDMGLFILESYTKPPPLFSLSSHPPFVLLLLLPPPPPPPPLQLLSDWRGV